MKITQKQAIDAYRTIRKLSYQDTDGLTAMFLFDLREKLEPRFRFQDEQEQNCIKQLGCHIDASGVISFIDEESKQKYLDKMEEINKLEIDLDIIKKPLDISRLTLNCYDIENLKPIVDVICS